MGIKVLSLFDGMSCGRIALERAGIAVDTYYASEIDKYAIAVSKDNYPDIVQLGDVINWREWSLPEIDLILAGSPCQGFSLSGKLLNFEDPRSKLYFEFEEILNAINPKYFMLENVKMAKKHCEVISERLNVRPILINSALFSAQNRERYYWTNIKVDTDIVDANITMPSDWQGAAIRGRYIAEGKTEQRLELRKDRKANCLTTVNKDSVYVKNGEVLSYTPEQKECLQTVPEGYTSCVSNSQRSKMLGNGWTVDVISHILRGIKEASV